MMQVMIPAAELQVGALAGGVLVKEARVCAVNLFFAASAAVYFLESIHLAVVLLQLNFIEASPEQMP